MVVWSLLGDTTFGEQFSCFLLRREKPFRLLRGVDLPQLFLKFVPESIFDAPRPYGIQFCAIEKCCAGSFRESAPSTERYEIPEGSLTTQIEGFARRAERYYGWRCRIKGGSHNSYALFLRRKYTII